MTRLPCLLGASLVLLAGCAASPARIAVGEDAASVQKRVGPPAQLVATPDGERWLYPTGPLGQLSFAVEIGPDHKVKAVKQVLTDEHFAEIVRGSWDQKRVREEFGPPAEESVQPRRHATIWSYRYKQDGVWNSLMHIYFDPQGLVQDYHPGPDPLYEPRDARDTNQ